MRKTLIAIYILFLAITPFVAEKYQGHQSNVFRSIASDTNCFNSLSSIISSFEERFSEIELRGVFLSELDELKKAGLSEEIQEQIILKSPIIQKVTEAAPELSNIIVRDLDHNTSLFNETFRSRLRTALRLLSRDEIDHLLTKLDSGYSFVKAFQKLAQKELLDEESLRFMVNSPYVKRNKIKLRELRKIANAVDDNPSVEMISKAIKNVLPIYDETVAGKHTKQLLSLGRYDAQIPVVEIHDQCYWGSCWAFASTELIEIKVSQRVGRKVPLSAEYFYAKYLINEASDIMIYGKPNNNIKLSQGSAVLNYRGYSKNFGIVPEEVWQPKAGFGSKATVKVLSKQLTDIIEDFYKKTKRGKTRQLIEQYQQKIIDAVEAKSGPLPDEFEFDDSIFTPVQFIENYFPEIDQKVTMVDTTIHIPSKNPHYSTTPKHIRAENGDWKLVSTSVDMLTKTQRQIEKTLIESIDQQTPVVISFAYPKNDDLIDSTTGEMTVPKRKLSNEIDGRHATVAVGYELNKDGRISSIKLLNSWGKDAVDNGFFHMNMEFFKKFAKSLLIYSNDQ